jgi:hypothetical protein
MSALGQKQTFTHLRPMSALPPKADMDQRSYDVRFVPKADIMQRSKKTSLFDHLVGIHLVGRMAAISRPAAPLLTRAIDP